MEVEFFFDFSCPYAYLGSTQIETLAERCGATLRWKPMLLGGVFRAVGTAQNMGAGMPAAKARHNLLDMHRWAALWSVPLTMPPSHPMRTVAALRALLSVADTARWPGLIHAIYQTYWVRGEDISDRDVLGAALERGGLSPAERSAALAANDDDSIKAELRRRTDEAIDRGVFGAPAMFVGSELFWGQDRLEQVATALGGSWENPQPAMRAGKDGGASIDFYYDFSSPFAYLASRRIEAVARGCGATLRWKPFLLGAVFKSIGTANVPLLAFSEAKRRYYADDLERWSTATGAELNWSSHFPLRTVTALRAALLCGDDAIAALSHAIFRAVWVEDSALTDDDLAAIVTEVGLEPDLVARAAESDAKAALFAATDEAIARGVFGAPTMIVSRPNHDDALFWGQDRLAMAGLAAAGVSLPTGLP